MLPLCFPYGQIKNKTGTLPMYTPPMGGCIIACQRGVPLQPWSLYESMKNTKNQAKPGKSVPISFRLKEDEFKPYAVLIEQSTLTTSAFFRKIFIDHDVNINLEQKKPVDYQRLLFLMNKSSNNINQIAKKVNTDYKSGTVSQATYSKVISELSLLNMYLKRMLDAG